MNKSHTLYVLFGQRKCSYEGEYFPEALFVDGEYSYSEDGGGYLEDKLQEELDTNEWQYLKIVEIEILENQLLTVLTKTPTIGGVVK